MIGQVTNGQIINVEEVALRNMDSSHVISDPGGQVNRAFVSDETSSMCHAGSSGSTAKCDQSDACEKCYANSMLVEQLKIYYPTVASELLIGSNDSPVKVIWQDVSVSVDVRSSYLPFAKTIHKQVLKSVSGSLTAGTLTALMGPSGAGKTTLLNAICGKLRDGVTGQRVIQMPQSLKSSLRIGFVPQEDSLFPQFTVQETILFASKLTNASLNPKEQKERVRSVMQQLDLLSTCNQRVDSLSGGQLKRTSIAVELISNPKILILDEPTTGLDSSNAEKVISLLKKLVTRAGKIAPAIVATIHQPSYDLFGMFDTIYLLSRYGRNIYSGPPSEIMDYFEKFGFERKARVNPADYAIEIANEKHGGEQLEEMERQTASRTTQSQEMSSSMVQVKVAKLEQKVALPFMKQFVMLTRRSFSAYAVKSYLMINKLIMNFAVTAFLCSLYKEPIGRVKGCWTDIITHGEPNYTDETEALKNVMLSTFEANKFTFDPTENSARIQSAMKFVFIILQYNVFMNAISGALTIPGELKVVSKEISNSWYGVTAYYACKMTVDFAFFVGTAALPVIYSFYITEQVPDAWRCFYYVFFLFCLAAGWEAKGATIGIFCTFDRVVAVALTVASMFPVIFLSGFFVLEEKLIQWIIPMTVVSDIRFAYRGIMLTLYGFGRCEKGQVIERLFDQMEGEVTPYKLFNIAWSSLNFTLSDMKRIEGVLNTKPGFLDTMSEALIDQHGESSVAIIDDDPNFQSSYVLDYASLDESMFNACLTYCLVNLVVLKLLILPVLHWKTRVSRL